MSNAVLSEESYTYDAAGNVTGSCGNTAFTYDINNRLTAYNGDTVSYDLDGNMLSAPLDCLTTAFSYDSANRLISAGGHTYTYNAEDVCIRNHYGDYNTTYTYNTVGKLSQLLLKNTNGNVTKYVYGLGLIGEEKQGCFKTYHFDYRGSTVAITDASGKITDTFRYDTYGKLLSRTGTSFVIFGYNGRDGVITDKNGLIYMRARYYAPELRRFVNADIIPGQISNAVTLNRYAYANGNPVTNIDPLGLIAERGSVVYKGERYLIYVPDHRTTDQAWDESWKTIEERIERDFVFDWLQFFAGVEIDDVNGIANGKNLAPTNEQQQATAGKWGVGYGLASSLKNLGTGYFVSLTFQEKGDQRRVIIKAGSSDVFNIYNKEANDIPKSGYFMNCGNGVVQDANSRSAWEIYNKITGNSTKYNFWDIYDIEITMDKRHKGSQYASYLWINSEGTVMESPIIYSNDKVSIVRRNIFFPWPCTPLIDIPIDGSSPVSEEYQKLFDKAIAN